MTGEGAGKLRSDRLFIDIMSLVQKRKSVTSPFIDITSLVQRRKRPVRAL